MTVKLIAWLKTRCRRFFFKACNKAMRMLMVPLLFNTRMMMMGYNPQALLQVFLRSDGVQTGLQCGLIKMGRDAPFTQDRRFGTVSMFPIQILKNPNSTRPSVYDFACPMHSFKNCFIAWRPRLCLRVGMKGTSTHGRMLKQPLSHSCC